MTRAEGQIFASDVASTFGCSARQAERWLVAVEKEHPGLVGRVPGRHQRPRRFTSKEALMSLLKKKRAASSTDLQDRVIAIEDELASLRKQVKQIVASVFSSDN